MQRANKIRRPNALEPSYTGRPVLMHSPIAATSVESLIAYLREAKVLRSKISTLKGASGSGRHTKYNYKAFTEKGLYMLATILKSEHATAATLAIIETFAKVRELKRELVALHAEKDKKAQGGKLKHFGELLADIVMPDLTDVETESSLELNFLVGKIKHTVRRIKRKLNPPND